VLLCGAGHSAGIIQAEADRDEAHPIARNGQIHPIAEPRHEFQFTPSFRTVEIGKCICLDPITDILRTPGSDHRAQRAQHRAPAALDHMGVDLRGSHVGMTELFLDRTNVSAALQQMSRE